MLDLKRGAASFWKSIGLLLWPKKKDKSPTAAAEVVAVAAAEKCWTLNIAENRIRIKRALIWQAQPENMELENAKH